MLLLVGTTTVSDQVRPAVADNEQGFGMEEVIARAGVSERLVRHCKMRGLIPGAGRADASGLDYTHEDDCALHFARRAHVMDFGMNEVARLLALWQNEHRMSSEVKTLALAQAEELESRIEELQAAKRILKSLANLYLGDHQPTCPIPDALMELKGFASQSYW